MVAVGELGGGECEPDSHPLFALSGQTCVDAGLIDGKTLASGVRAWLGVLAGAFIGLGAMLFVLVKSDPTLGFAASSVLGGLVFAMGLLMVVVAGAELFTGNNFLVMAWAEGRIPISLLARNWAIVDALKPLGITDIDLQSVGVGLNFNWGRHLSLSLTAANTLKDVVPDQDGGQVLAQIILR